MTNGIIRESSCHRKVVPTKSSKKMYITREKMYPTNVTNFSGSEVGTNVNDVLEVSDDNLNEIWV